MELTNDLRKALYDGFDNAKSVEVSYGDDDHISGFVKNINMGSAFEVVLCKHRSQKNESPLHYLDISQATKIVIIYPDGVSQVFE